MGGNGSFLKRAAYKWRTEVMDDWGRALGMAEVNKKIRVKKLFFLDS